MNKLEELRAKLKAKTGGSGGGGDGASFPFWNIPDGGYVTARFLPDGDESNSPFFWLEKQMFKWSFADPDKPGEVVKITIPCKEMYDGFKTCDVVNELRSYFKSKDPDAETLAKALWPKKSYIYQGFVRNTSQPIETAVPDNPIRIFNINKEIHTLIYTSIMSENPNDKFDVLPSDYEAGTDFIINKTRQSQYASYKTSKWAKNSSALSDEELSHIEKHGLFKLKDRLPNKPSDEAYETLAKMFEAYVNGDPWDRSWEQHFRPFGSDDNSSGGGNGASNSSSAAEAVRSAPVSRTPDPEPEKVKEESNSQSSGASDVMARLKARANSSKEEEPDAEESSGSDEAPASKHSDVIARLRARRAQQ